MTPAGAEDLPDIERFLKRHGDVAMFPRANLDRYGLDGAADHAPTFWIARDGDEVTDALTVTRGGAVFPILPSGDWEAASALLRGRTVTHAIGAAEYLRPLVSAAGLGRARTTLDSDEPLLARDLSPLAVPDGPGRILPLAEVPRDTAIEWRSQYVMETLGIPQDRARSRAASEVDAAIAVGSHVMLFDGDTPLAMTGFNAALPEIVQIGGVYVPPERRGQGLARRAVALHLTAARERGVSRAVCFAASDAALRAYRGLGFERIGTLALCFFDGPQEVS
ncbi:Acetyltransferase (GNAT) family protein [Tranquillimonas rosea]|uniref:Acetyltransferase (GNAT) family protein n=1 Tax=Tranquillimonas rosea TaxID=641238 RepID=A0A1H9SFC7_9RHOB|nr:GNAT family N-acetyltransferase [Tranquillimonas rosea]SER83608.1 Acetyltransferase (GNAT) family protein [Tranquillimonas rosea]